MTWLVLALATALSGECGSVGNGCELAIAGTMAVRYEECGNWDTVLGAYYGWAEPTAASYAAARLLVRCPPCLAGGGYRYAYSDQDVQRMGWREGDEQICGGGLCVHLSKEWPGGE